MEIYQEVAALTSGGQSGVICTIVFSQGSTPRHIGSKMLVFGDGKFVGTVGGGEVESRVIREALEALKDGKPRLLRYNMVDPARGDPGVCGGQLEVFVEPIQPEPTIVVIGGGHVGKAVTHLARWLGFRVALSDDRPEYCTPEYDPDAQEFYPFPMKELPQHLPINSQTYLILTTRGAPVDIAGLPELLKTDPAYLGVIGSKRRWMVTRKALIEAGIPGEALDRIHSPLGIEINAETPEEIAVSILAQIIQQRNGGSKKITNQ